MDDRRNLKRTNIGIAFLIHVNFIEIGRESDKIFRFVNVQSQLLISFVTGTKFRMEFKTFTDGQNNYCQTFYAARDLLRSKVSLHLLLCTVIVRNVKLANVFSL